MKELKHVSASSITLFESCETRWYHRYINGFTTKQTDAMARGSAVHKQLEDYLLHKKLPDTSSVAGRIAEKGVELLPEGEWSDKEVEVSLEAYPLPNTPLPFKGFIDLLDTTNGIEIIDHKTTSAWKWAKTEEQLAVNIQLIIYAKHVMHHHPDVDEATLTHIYYLTRPPHGSRKVSVTVTRDHVDAEFAKILAIVHRMVERANTGIAHCDKNQKYCFSYGKRCPHYDPCFNTLVHYERKPMSDKQEDILNYLRGTPAPTPDTTELRQDAQPEVINEAVTIYIGCRPMYGEAISLIDHIQPLMKEVCKEKGVEHIGFIPYAQGWDLLSAKLQLKGLPNGAYYIPAMSQVAQRLGDTLINIAHQVVISE